MSMLVHTAPQGSPEWLADRATRFNAGDAAAMLGCDVNGRTRTDLLDEMATGLTPEVGAFKQRLYDKGHQVEALMRPLAEELLGEELYSLVGSIAVDGLSRRVGASFDGATMAREKNFEAKSLNEALAAALPVEDDPDANDAANLPKGYRVQLEQQQLVNGATVTLFGAGEFHPDGSTKSQRWCWYTSDPALRAEILAGWAQFDADLATHKPVVIAEMPKADVTIELPALFIHAKGEITTSNMKEFGVALAARLEAIRSITWETDQDFANAKAAAANLRETIEKAKLSKAAMLAQTATVGEAANMIDAWCEDMRLTALQLEKDVEREDKAKKTAMIDAAKVKYAAHIEAINTELSPARLTVPAPVFADAIKNKRSFASMQDAINTMLANAKIAADDQARTIRAALACLAEEGKDFEFLLADRLTLIGKPVEDLRTLVRARITEHKAAKAREEEATRERIRAEEQAKAEKDAREQLAAEQAERDRIADQAATPAPTAAPAQPLAAAPIAPPASVSQAPAANSSTVVQMGTRAPAAPSSPPTLTLGAISERLGFTVTAEFVGRMGLQGTKVRNAALFHEADVPRLIDSIVAHLRSVQHELQAA